MKIKFWKSHGNDKWYWTLTDKGRVIERGEHLHDIEVCLTQIDALAIRHPEASIEYRAKPGN